MGGLFIGEKYFWVIMSWVKENFFMMGDFMVCYFASLDSIAVSFLRWNELCCFYSWIFQPLGGRNRNNSRIHIRTCHRCLDLHRIDNLPDRYKYK